MPRVGLDKIECSHLNRARIYTGETTKNTEREIRDRDNMISSK